MPEPKHKRKPAGYVKPRVKRYNRPKTFHDPIKSIPEKVIKVQTKTPSEIPIRRRVYR